MLSILTKRCIRRYAFIAVLVVILAISYAFLFSERSSKLMVDSPWRTMLSLPALLVLWLALEAFGEWLTSFAFWDRIGAVARVLLLVTIFLGISCLVVFIV
jgi:hypothetical protein